MDMYYLYLVGDSILSGYIGVTNNPKVRFRYHTKSKYKVGTYIRENNLNFLSMKLLVLGNMEYCFDLEKRLRPYPNMGLNESSGGHGGYTSYVAERNMKISKALSGKKKRECHKHKLSLAARDRYNGHKNPRAKEYHIIDPDGKNYKVHGCLVTFCRDHDIIVSVMRKYVNCGVVPKPNLGQDARSGGFRPKSPKHMIQRLNTVGWRISF